MIHIVAYSAGNRGMPERTREYLRRLKERAHVINVTEARDATSGNGHGYFLASLSVSSDILMTLMYRLDPEGRGLTRGGDGVWFFPDDYVDRLRVALRSAAEKEARSTNDSE